MAEKIVFANRSFTNSLKWDGYSDLFHVDDLLPLWVADMDFEICQSAKDAIESRSKHHVYGYPIVDSKFYETIVLWHYLKFGTKIEPDHIVPLNGVVSAIFAAIQTFSIVGDNVAIITPVYGPFFSVPRSLGRDVLEIPLSVGDSGYYLDFELFEELISTNKPKIFILCNPHNPIGKMWQKNELYTILEICKKNGCFVVSDEIHSDIVFDNSIHQPLYDTVNNGCISLYAPTKSFNLPGLNVAYAVIKDKNIKQTFLQIANGMHITLPNVFGMEVLKAVYSSGEQWLNSVIELLQDNRNKLEHFFKSRSYAKFYKPNSTYLGWIDFKHSMYDAKEIKIKLLKEAKVGLSGGDFFFGGRTTTCHRINFATSDKILNEALYRIDKAFS